MVQIELSDLQANADKYVTLAQEQDVYITRNGELVAKLVTAKPNKEETFKRFLGLPPDSGLNFDAEKAREERLIGRL